MPEPLLVLVSGPPGAGKTTLGAKIARELGIPFLNKDGIKETLFDVLGWKDQEWSRRLGIASTALLFRIIERQLAAGCSLVAESAFHSAFDRPRLEQLQGQYPFRTMEVHCTAPMAVLLARYAGRAQSAERHPGHGDQAKIEALRAHLERGVYGQLSLPGQALIVDTTEVASVDDQRLIAAIRARAARQGSG